jgi:hypothetical protein
MSRHSTIETKLKVRSASNEIDSPSLTFALSVCPSSLHCTSATSDPASVCRAPTLSRYRWLVCARPAGRLSRRNTGASRQRKQPAQCRSGIRDSLQGSCSVGRIQGSATTGPPPRHQRAAEGGIRCGAARFVHSCQDAGGCVVVFVVVVVIVGVAVVAV